MCSILRSCQEHFAFQTNFASSRDKEGTLSSERHIGRNRCQPVDMDVDQGTREEMNTGSMLRSGGLMLGTRILARPLMQLESLAGKPHEETIFQVD